MNDPYRNECRAVSELLLALAAAELVPEHAAQLHTHLAQCATCQAELAALQQTRALAAGLKLDSPALDRYPEFLRRLAADEAAHTQQALMQLTASAAPAMAYEAAAVEAEPTPPNSGVAAVVPLFGRRVLLRSGFGKGFELTLVSPQGRELFRLAATSLARVAAVAAGVSIFAGLSIFGLFLLVTALWQAQPRQEQVRPQPPYEFPARRGASLPPRDWVQTFSHKNDTLAIWQAEGQLWVNWLNTESAALKLVLPHIAGERWPPPRIFIAGASDGQAVVLVREGPQGVWAWHVAAEASRRAVEPIQPVMIAPHSVQPALAWFGDRYLLAFVNPSQTAPHIELLQLDRVGQPLQARGLLAATTEEADKVGWPTLVSTGQRGALFFFTEKGELQGRTLRLEQDRVELGARVYITAKQRRKGTPLRALALAEGGFLLCWGEVEADRFELRLARLNAHLQPQTLVALVATAAPVPAFDWRLDGAVVSLAWLEEQPDQARIFAQRFDLDGLALNSPQPLFATEAHRAGLAFADAAGRKLIWLQRAEDGKLRLQTAPLR